MPFMHSMELRKLRHMVALAEEANFSRAAERLHLTQPALSRSIQSLENELGVRLFDRNLNSVVLTPVGKKVLVRARALLFDARSLNHEVQLLRQGELGDISMGVGAFPGTTFMPPILAELVRERPRLRVDIEFNSWQYLLEHLLNENIEFFVAEIRAIPPDRRVAVSPLVRQLMGFVANAKHPLAERAIRAPGELLNYPLISVRLPEQLQEQLCHYLGISADKQLPLTVVSNNPSLLEYIGLNTDALLMISFAVVQRQLESGHLVVLRTPKWPSSVYADLGIVTLAGRTLSPTAQWLIDRMRILAAETSDKALTNKVRSFKRSDPVP